MKLCLAAGRSAATASASASSGASSGASSHRHRCRTASTSTSGRHHNAVVSRSGLLRSRRKNENEHDVIGGFTRTRAVASPAPEVADGGIVDGELTPVTEYDGGKRLQAQVVDIAADTTAIRCLDWDRERFDIEFGLQNGTTYNSYVIKGAEKTALVDASHEKFTTLYMDTLKGVVDPSTIDYIVCSHTEPDHSFLIPEVLKLAPNATVIATKVALGFLSNQINGPFAQQVAKPGDSIDLGGGHVLQFTAAPNLHWPDTMFTFDTATGVVYTCDAFGQHFCSTSAFDADLVNIMPHYRFYYDCLMRPNARSVLTALRKTKDLEFNVIATGHGEILRNNVGELVESYRGWSEKAVEKASASVAVLYCADYGFSDRLSQSLARGITKTGCGVEMIDLMSSDTQELVEGVAHHAGLVVMSPPLGSSGERAFATLLAAVKKQRFIICESYGGNDEPVDTMSTSLENLGLDQVIPPLKVRDTPTESTYQLFEEAGTDLGQALTLKESLNERKAAMPADLAQALARVSGGLYVVTAVRGDSRSAMIASWVAQASFEPLGITVSVAKDRAIESLMNVGDAFVLNCLEDGTYDATLKHFLKRFPPGADRFEGVKCSEAAETKAPVLEAATAHLECRVTSRMETSDHWVVYAEVIGGTVSKPDSLTAVHHRKSATFY